MAVIMALVAIVLLPAASGAAEGEAGQEAAPAQGPPPIELSLQDAIRLAVEGNLDIQVARLEPEMSLQDEIVALSFYDPNLFASYQKDKQKQMPSDFLQSSSSETDVYIVGVDKEFTTGGKATLSWYNSRNDQTAYYPIAFNPSYGTSFGLSFTQPLLRNWRGRPQQNRIVIARNNLEVSRSSVQTTALDTLKGVTDAYWDLKAAHANLKVARESLELAEKQLKLNRAKVEVGTAAPIEITQAEAGVSSREESVIIAENLIRTAEDNLRQVLNPPKTSELWTRPIVAKDEPAYEIVSPLMDDEVATALSTRPELEQERLRQKNLELQAAIDADGVKPQLDLSGYYNLAGTAGDQRIDKAVDKNGDGTLEPVDANGDGLNDVIFVPESITDAWKMITDRELPNWGVGLAFSVPIGNRAAKAAYARSLLAVEQGRLSLQSAELGVEIEVRDAVRQVETNVKRVSAARKNVELQVKNLEAEEKRFQYGMTTSFQVLQYQRDLTDAKSATVRAVLDYMKSLAALARATGTLLEKQGVEVR